MKPTWYTIMDPATLRVMLDQKDQHYRQASEACNRVADQRDRYKKALEAWKWMMANDAYDMGEMVAEFDKIVTKALDA